MDEKMTQKFTAEEVRANLCVVERVRNNIHSTYKALPEDWHDWALEQVAELTCAVNFRNDLTAYADTLSKPADSGRVGDAVVERAASAFMRVRGLGMPRPWENMLETSRESYRPAFRAALEAALAAQGQAVAEVIRNEAGQVYLKWAAKKSINDFIGAKVYTRPDPPASPAGVPDVRVDKQGVRFGDGCWYSHERITGCGYVQINEGRCSITAREYMKWVQKQIAAATSAPDGGEVGL